MAGRRDAGGWARMLGVGLVVAGVVAFVWVDGDVAYSLLFAGVATGLFLALVAGARSVPADVVPAILEGASREVASAIEALGLEGRAVYAPPSENLSRDRVFLPASENAKPLPLLDDATYLHQGPPEFKTGLSLPHQGGGLVAAHAEATGEDPRGAPLPEAEAFLRGLGLENGLFTGLRVTRDGDRLVAAFRPAVETPCLGALAEKPPCDRGGCALCQSVGCVLARSLDRPLPVADAGPDGDRVVMRFAVEAVPEGEGEPDAEAAA